MKRILIIISALVLIFSCSNSNDDDKVDCLAEKLEIIEKYDRLIALEEGNELAQQILERNKQIELDALDC